MKYEVLKDMTTDKLTGKVYNAGDTITLSKERGDAGVKKGRLKEIKKAPKPTKSTQDKTAKETIKK